MNEIALSDDLNQIELEIKHHKNIAGQSIWEIGRRLNHVKENDLAHGQFGDWLEKIEFSHYVANQFMKVAKELPNYSTSNNLGLNALYLIATLPEEEREKEHELEDGKRKSVDEMTVRELQEVKRKNREQEKIIEELKNKEPEVIEKEITIERVPEDYDFYKSNYEATKSNYEFYKNQNEELRSEMKILEEKIGGESANESDVVQLEKELKETKAKFKKIEKEYSQFNNFKEDVEEMIHKYAPMKYFGEFEEILRDKQAFGDLVETIDMMEKWVKEMKEEIPNQIIIEGDK